MDNLLPKYWGAENQREKMDKVNLFDFNFLSTDSIEKVVTAIIEKGTKNRELQEVPFVITPNVDQIVKYHKIKELYPLKQFVKKSSFILPDGKPIVWASKILGKPLKTRLPGSDLFPLLWNEIKKKGLNAFLIVSSKQLKQFFIRDYKNCLVKVAPYFSSPFSQNEFKKFAFQIANEISSFNPHFIFIGISFPKQELLAYYIYNLLSSKEKIPIFLLLGASFEFYFGIKKRAPVIFQKLGLEWLYRFLTEPTRLFKRYFIDDITFINLVIKEYKKIKIKQT